MRDILVGMGETVASQDRDVVLTALGLGSCIGIFAYDYRAMVGGCAHVVLPHATGAYDPLYPAKCMNTAFDSLIQSIQDITKSSRYLSWALVGGAQLFKGLTQIGLMDIGARNIKAAQEQMIIRDINPIYTDFGGDKGRTAKLYITDGLLYMRVLGQQDQPLADMRLNKRIKGQGQS